MLFESPNNVFYVSKLGTIYCIDCDEPTIMAALPANTFSFIASIHNAAELSGFARKMAQIEEQEYLFCVAA